jgi:hypothetical protein
MRITLIGAHVVQVIREHEREANLWREAEELFVQATLFGEAVILHLKEEAPLSKDFAVLPGESARMLPVIDLKRTGNLAIQAAGESDKALRVPS